VTLGGRPSDVGQMGELADRPSPRPLPLPTRCQRHPPMGLTCLNEESAAKYPHLRGSARKAIPLKRHGDAADLIVGLESTWKAPERPAVAACIASGSPEIDFPNRLLLGPQNPALIGRVMADSGCGGSDE